MIRFIENLNRLYWQKRPHEPVWQRRESLIASLTYFDCQLCGFSTYYTDEWMTAVEGKFDYGKDLKSQHDAQ